MFLIFSLGRLDIFSVYAESLRRAIKWLYGFTDNHKSSELMRISKSWTPYSSAAVLYLWEAVDTNLISENTANI